MQEGLAILSATITANNYRRGCGVTVPVRTFHLVNFKRNAGMLNGIATQSP
jgi:hypothetical protein